MTRIKAGKNFSGILPSEQKMVKMSWINTKIIYKKENNKIQNKIAIYIYIYIYTVGVV